MDELTIEVRYDKGDQMLDIDIDAAIADDDVISDFGEVLDELDDIIDDLEEDLPC